MLVKPNYTYTCTIRGRCALQHHLASVTFDLKAVTLNMKMFGPILGFCLGSETFVQNLSFVLFQGHVICNVGVMFALCASLTRVPLKNKQTSLANTQLVSVKEPPPPARGGPEQQEKDQPSDDRVAIKQQGRKLWL